MGDRILLLLFFTLAVSASAQNQGIVSTLEIYDIETDERRVVLKEDAHFEAPNWSADGKYFIINQNGGLFKVYWDGKKEKLDTGFADRCNNDHGISPDGKTLAISHNVESGEGGWLTSCIFTLPIEGGTPVRVTENTPSFWHGWSPDGSTLVYTAKRGEHFNIYSIPVTGGEETALTDTEGLDDGPEYSPDGKYIYYNSIRSGKMEIWRMHPDGSKPEQLTEDELSNWFPHPSPDGKHLVIISYLKDQGSAHPPMKEVALRLYNLKTGSIRTLCEFTGGQGTINVPSWSSDGKRFAFVSYAYK
ncbi:transporter [Pricia sp. S334]|uniref:Transporter n=1 Tax=Pricia mediterranea TaxID=3076079 RepID=A0ABU3LAB0_9FLAO|nr:transporter [Pricia sp. S334]MDT7830168.1 transporter [Pricia sp. S334]